MDQHYMSQALQLSQNGQSLTYPNPMVGAVVVKDGEVIGEGWHHGPGLPHAEVEALNDCKVDPGGATMYVTLEPCNHWGKTPPCAKAIIEAGISTVKMAVRDPNPGVAGGGAARLREAGITVEEGMGREEAIEINRGFFYHALTGRPWVIMKSATSLDGKITDTKGESKWITGEESRRLVHQLRSQAGAVLIGSGTMIKDNPQLNNRLYQPAIRQPLKVILDSELKISVQSKLVTDAPLRLLVFCTGRASLLKEKELRELGVQVIRQDTPARVVLPAALVTMGSLGIQSVLVEGGSEIFAAFLQEDLVNEFYLFYAPFFIGGPAAKDVIGGTGATLTGARRLLVRSLSQTGQDILVHAYKEELTHCLPV
jgi:diaminohydroxyphosphoribosylaminopyrimidine deaminase / 5-amino-6-(5-phosphoribosylamino)uracil reductase